MSKGAHTHLVTFKSGRMRGTSKKVALPDYSVEEVRKWFEAQTSEIIEVSALGEGHSEDSATPHPSRLPGGAA